MEHSHRRAGFSHRLDLALAAATRAHHGAFRKGTDVPYAMHPFHVAFILERHGLPEDVVIAGLLHDVLEDSDVYSEDDLRSEFGEEVLRLVKAVTELRRQGGVRPPWEERKEEQLERLRGARVDEVSLKAADAFTTFALSSRTSIATASRRWIALQKAPRKSSGTTRQ